MFKRAEIKIKKLIYSFIANDHSKTMINYENDIYEILKNNKIELSSLISKKIEKKPNYSTYQKLHNERNGSYSRFNWSFQIKNNTLFKNVKNTFELGAGNGEFVKYLNQKGVNARGLDLINPSKNKNILTIDVDDLKINCLYDVDLIYSADFLEHLTLDQIDNLFNKINNLKSDNLHLIACYDDKISHLSVFTPGEWLYIFSKYFQSCKIIDIGYRRYPFKKKFVLIYAKSYKEKS